MKTFLINISIPLLVFALLLIVAVQNAHAGAEYGGIETTQPPVQNAIHGGTMRTPARA